jgi:phage baseplate assembly protein W
MAILDKSKRPSIIDRNENIFIGIDMPFRKSDGAEGMFASTQFTIDAIKNNVKILLNTEKGERLFQPNLGIGLKRFLFEPNTQDTRVAIENEIVDTFNVWLPFVTIRDIQISSNDTDAIGRNKLSIYIEFNLNKDPNTLESVQIDIGE